jgi:hypothetical protein
MAFALDPGMYSTDRRGMLPLVDFKESPRVRIQFDLIRMTGESPNNPRIVVPHRIALVIFVNYNKKERGSGA